jgi:hypothetical protein
MTAVVRHLTAVVVHPDPGFLGFASEALSTFEPGYRVATAFDVARASAWIGHGDVDLLVISAAIASPASLADLLAPLKDTQTRVVLTECQELPSQIEELGLRVDFHPGSPNLTELLSVARLQSVLDFPEWLDQKETN